MTAKWTHLLIVPLMLLTLNVNATVRIGTPAFDPPFVVNDGHYVVSGFDIDIMQKICSRLQWDCEFIVVERANILDKLANHEIDYAIGSLAITPQNQAECLFSVPYMITVGGFVMSKSSEINSVESLKGKRIAAMEGSIYLDYIMNNPDYNSQVLSLPPKPGVIATALTNNKADAAFVNYYSAMYLERQYPTLAKALNTGIPFGNGLGIATSFDNQVGIEKINKVLNQFEVDGTFLMIYKYNFAFFMDDIKDQ